MENENFNNLKMMMDIKVPMSDGICLSTNIYLPKDNLPCPIILQRSPYGTNTEEMVKELEAIHAGEGEVPPGISEDIISAGNAAAAESLAAATGMDAEVAADLLDPNVDPTKSLAAVPEEVA